MMENKKKNDGVRRQERYSLITKTTIIKTINNNGNKAITQSDSNNRNGNG